MDSEDEDDIKDTSHMFYLYKNGSAQHSEAVKLNHGMHSSAEGLRNVSGKKARRSHSLGNLIAPPNEVGNFISFMWITKTYLTGP